MTYLANWVDGDDALKDVLIGREVVNIREGHESSTLLLDDGTELTIDGELGCCAYGVVTAENVVGGTIMSVDTAVADDDPDSDADSIYKIFLLKNGLPGGTITVESYEGSGYYGTGYSLDVRKPEKS